MKLRKVPKFLAWWWWRRLKGNWYPRKMITITKLPKLDWKFVDHVELEYKNFELKGLFFMRRMKMNFALTMLSSIKIMWLKINLRSMKVILMLVGRANFLSISWKWFCGRFDIYWKKFKFQSEELNDHLMTNFCEDLNESKLDEKVTLDPYSNVDFSSSFKVCLQSIF